MKTYVVINRTGIELKSGKVQLTKEQVERRASRLSAVKDQTGVYEIKSSTMFKCGEKFGYDGTVSKSMLEEIADEAEAKRMEEEKKTAAAKAHAVNASKKK